MVVWNYTPYRTSRKIQYHFTVSIITPTSLWLRFNLTPIAFKNEVSYATVWSFLFLWIVQGTHHIALQHPRSHLFDQSQHFTPVPDMGSTKDGIAMEPEWHRLKAWSDHGMWIRIKACGWCSENDLRIYGVQKNWCTLVPVYFGTLELNMQRCQRWQVKVNSWFFCVSGWGQALQKSKRQETHLPACHARSTAVAPAKAVTQPLFLSSTKSLPSKDAGCAYVASVQSLPKSYIKTTPSEFTSWDFLAP